MSSHSHPFARTETKTIWYSEMFHKLQCLHSLTKPNKTNTNVYLKMKLVRSDLGQTNSKKIKQPKQKKKQNQITTCN